MRLLPLIALTAAVAARPAPAQDKPDFSGSWTLNDDQSDPPAAQGRGMGRPTGLMIKQTDSTLTIEVKTSGGETRTTSYYLDGRESHNAGMRGQDMVTRSRWEGTTLVTEGENTVKTQMGEMTIKSKEVRSLSDDGKTLTVVSSFTTPRGERTRKLVFQKQ